MVIGSGPNRIGQGIEFGLLLRALPCGRCARRGYEAIIINNNPETVSTDFDTSDILFFEPLTTEDVLNIIEQERPEGVWWCSSAGQTAINLAGPLTEAGVRILGTSFHGIELAEDRELFDDLLSELDIRRPRGRAVTIRGRRAGDGARDRLPRAGAPQLRAGRSRHGDRGMTRNSSSAT